MSEKVRYEVTDRVAIVTLNRPEVLNALDLEVFDALEDAAARAGSDPDVRAVLIAGEGRAFSSGLDTSLFASGLANGDPIRIDIARLQRAFTVYERLPKPVVAAIAGPCLGGGLQLALACDLRVASSDATFAVLELVWGIIPDLGGTQRLPRIVGLGRAKEMIMTTRRLEAAEALASGLVNRVVERERLYEEAFGLARALAGGPPLALAAVKRLTLAAFDQPVETGLDREAQVQRRILASSDVIEAISARLQKRAPQFQAR